jgi:hypothetical protein
MCLTNFIAACPLLSMYYIRTIHLMCIRPCRARISFTILTSRRTWSTIPKSLGTICQSRRFTCSDPRRSGDNDPPKPILRENIYTLPNLLTVSRILACPVLGWSILKGHFHLATSLLLYAGFTDLVRRRFYSCSRCIIPDDGPAKG